MFKVIFSNKATKLLGKLPIHIAKRFLVLVKDLEVVGPIQPNWPHFGKLKGQVGIYHCHFRTGRPTYVACWELKNNEIEVNYVGTHENAPY